MNRRLRTLLGPAVGALAPLAALLARQTLRRGKTAVSVSLVRDWWLGRHVARYGPGEGREYLCLGLIPWVRIEVWRDARPHEPLRERRSS